MKKMQYETAGTGHLAKRMVFMIFMALVLLATDPAFAAPGDPCGWNRRRDCRGQCIHTWYFNNWIGDGYCDDGTWGVYFNCAEFNCDGGDCNDCCYADNDNDGFGGSNAVPCGPGSVLNNNDCNDNDPDIHPGATEVCDFIDNDCDTSVDEGLPMQYYYRDADGDGYGNPNNSVYRCMAPSGYVADNTDCNDGNASIHPGATEICDGQDNDCNAIVDDGLAENTYFRDADGDGYGNAGNTYVTCYSTPPSGYVTDDTDCNDSDPGINPGTTEVCDGIDNNCDTQIDEGFPTTTYYADTDSDGYGDPGNSVTTCMPMPGGYVTDNTDCDDSNYYVHPGGTDLCGNGLDEDCVDGDRPCETGDDCNCGWDQVWEYVNGQWVLLTKWVCPGNYTYDCEMNCQPDWWINNHCGDGTCENDIPSNPGPLNCDFFSNDCGDCQIIYDCYEDADGDGYGDPNGAHMNAPCAAGYADNPDDCDDTDPAINPAASEICDLVDNNCDGDADEGLPVFTYYQDGDGDGYGNPSVTMQACGPPGNFVSDNTDCDDTNADIHPGAYDLCENGLDEDCNGSDRVCGETPNVCADLSDFPLETQVEAAPPIVMLLMDDSGSMAWSNLCPEHNGKFSGYSNYYDVDPYWKSQWAGYNGIYYNPDQDYDPWPDTGTATYDDADMDDPRSHPHSSSTRDLSNEFDYLDGVSVKWAHYYVWSTMEDAPYLVNITGNNGSYSLNYYKVTDCNNGACSSDHSYVDDYVYDSTPPTDVMSGRTPEEERQNFANWYQYFHNRQLTAISAIANVVNSVQGMDIGLHTINHNNSINMIAPRDVDVNRGPILDDLYDVGASGGTPLRRGLEDVGEYFDNDNSGPYYSAANGGECQQAYCIMMTDGYYNGSDPSVGNADGNNNTDYDGGEFADSYSNTLADVAMEFYERDLNDDLGDLVPISSKDFASHQHMVTYSISFGLAGLYDQEDYPDCPTSNCPVWPNVDEHSEDERSITDLWHAAENGRGEYMEATNARQLAYALVALMQDVSKREGSGASVAVNSHELKEGTKIYQGTYNSAGWTGDLRAYSINLDGSVNETPLWSAAEALDTRVANNGHGDRDIYTMGASGGIEFTAANLGSLTTQQQNLLGADVTARTNLINFIRGDFSQDENHSGGLRARVSRMGDIVHSAPQYVNGYMYVGANDGMLHVFDATDGREVFAYIPSFVYANFEELANPDYTHRYFVDSTPFLGYVGSEVLLIGGLGKGGQGYYCLEIDIDDPGTFSASDVRWEYPNSGSSSAEFNNLGYTFSEPVIVPTESAGKVLVFGNGYDSINARAVLYALDPATGTMLKMIDTGYGSPNPGDNNCNGLSTPVFVDTNNNGKADVAYAGDMQGNVWKFDISGSTASWDVAYVSGGGSPRPLFQARDSSGNPQPITTKLAVRGHCVRGYSGYIVVFGTGKFNSSGDFTSTSTQAIYGVWDWAPEWEEEGVTGADKPLGAFNDPSAGNLSGLVAHPDLTSVGPSMTLVTQSQSGGTTTYNDKTWGLTSSTEINWFNVEAFLEGGTYGDDADEGDHMGWTFLLPESGERVVANPILWDEYVLIVSQVPASSMCTVGGDSYLYALNVCSGGAPDEPFFNLDDDEHIDEYDTIAGQVPSQVQLDDFVTYSPTGILDEEDELIYFYTGPTPPTMANANLSRIIFWRFLDLD